MSKEHVFFGKFHIEPTDDSGNCKVSAVPMSDKEIDALAGIVRCKDCERASIDQTDHESREGLRCNLFSIDPKPYDYCAWGSRHKVVAQ